MSATEILAAASDPEFFTRVGFIAMRVAQNVAAEDPATVNHANRVAYSNRILVGAESNLLLAQHVASSNATIAATLESQGGAAVPDGDIEFALATIWDARSNAFAGSSVPDGVRVQPPFSNDEVPI